MILIPLLVTASSLSNYTGPSPEQTNNYKTGSPVATMNEIGSAIALAPLKTDDTANVDHLEIAIEQPLSNYAESVVIITLPLDPMAPEKMALLLRCRRSSTAGSKCNAERAAIID